jgi:hypothetical protein
MTTEKWSQLLFGKSGMMFALAVVLSDLSEFGTVQIIPVFRYRSSVSLQH